MLPAEPVDEAALAEPRRRGRADDGRHRSPTAGGMSRSSSSAARRTAPSCERVLAAAGRVAGIVAAGQAGTERLVVEADHAVL